MDPWRCTTADCWDYSAIRPKHRPMRLHLRTTGAATHMHCTTSVVSPRATMPRTASPPQLPVHPGPAAQQPPIPGLNAGLMQHTPLIAQAALSFSFFAKTRPGYLRSEERLVGEEYVHTCGIR